MTTQPINARRGMTIAELMVVLAVLMALASLSVPMLSNAASDARRDATRETLRQLQDVILTRYVPDMQGVLASSTSPAIAAGLPGASPSNLQPSGRTQHPQLHFLFINPMTNDAVPTYDPVIRRGWHGPYLVSGRGGEYPGVEPTTATPRGFGAIYGVAGDQAVLDGWGNPIVVRLDTAGASLVSAGPDGSLVTTVDNLTIRLQ